MPKLLPIPFATIPKELLVPILDKLDPEENSKLLKTNHYLRYKVLSNGLFGKWVRSIEIQDNHHSEDIPSDSLTVTLWKNGYPLKFDVFESLPSLFLKKIKTCGHLLLVHKLSDHYGHIEEPLRVLLEKLDSVGSLYIAGFTIGFLNTISEGFNFKVKEDAVIRPDEWEELEITDNFTHFIENGLRFCKKISIHGLCENLLNALSKTQVEMVDLLSERCEFLDHFPEWIVRNGLPSENQNCSLIISVIFDPERDDIVVLDPFSYNSLLKRVRDVKIYRKMEREMRKVRAGTEEEIGRIDKVRCFRTRGRVDDLRFFMARETGSRWFEEEEFEILNFFVKRLK